MGERRGSENERKGASVTYERFERLVLVVGGIAAIGAMVIASGRQPALEELAGQVLLLAVIMAAVHWGRKGGFAAAVGASLAYFVLRTPLVVAEGGLTEDAAVILGSRVLAYGVIGILGGELFGRIKYLFARLEDASSIDPWTGVFKQAAVTRTLQASQGRFSRYGERYSVILLSLAPALTEGLRPSRERSVLKRVADHLRNDVRLVDEVGRLDDGRFMLVLPHTPTEGGRIACDRLRAGVRDLLGARDDSVSASVFGVPEDEEAIRGILADLSSDAVQAGAAQPDAASSVA